MDHDASFRSRAADRPPCRQAIEAGLPVYEPQPRGPRAHCRTVGRCRHVVHAVVVGVVALGPGCTRFGVANPQPPPTAAIRPELVLQVGHTSYVDALAVSPNGRFIASGGLDGAVKIWDAHSGRLLRPLNGTLYSSPRLAFRVSFWDG
jgi:hypothetical protein